MAEAVGGAALGSMEIILEDVKELFFGEVRER